MTINFRPIERGSKGKLPLDKFFKLSTGRNPLCKMELWTEENKFLKLHFDIDAKLEVGSDIRPYEDETLAFVEKIANRYDVNKCVIVDFCGKRDYGDKMLYKFSKHLIFPDIRVENKYLSRFSNRDMCCGYFGDFAALDEGNFKIGGMLRQFGTKKPRHMGVAIGGNASGEISIWKSGNIKTYKDVSLELFASSLVSHFQEGEGSIDITEDIVEFQKGFVAPQRAIQPSKNKEEKEEKTIPDIFIKKARETSSIHVRAIQILYELGSEWAQHKKRFSLYSTIKRVERDCGINEGLLFLDWFNKIRVDPNQKDYLKAYIDSKYDRNSTNNFIARLNKIKREEGLNVSVIEKLLVSAQKDFKDNRLAGAFKTSTDLKKYMFGGASDDILNRPGSHRNNFLSRVFSNCCFGYRGEKLCIVYKCSVEDKIVYEVREKKPDTVFFDPMFKTTRGEGDKKVEQFVSLHRFIKKHFPLICQNFDYSGAWENRGDGVNLSPPGLVLPERNSEYDDWKERFEDYFKRSFLGNESDPDKFMKIIMSWYRQMVFGKEPTEKIVICSGEKGLGKSLMFNLLPSLILGKYYVRNVSDGIGFVSQNFNDINPAQRLVVFEEASSYSRSDMASFEKLKDMITASTFERKRKYEDVEICENTISYAILSNNSNPILAGEDDRRIIFLDMKNVFKSIRERASWMNDWARMMLDNVANFAWYLNNECEDWTKYRHAAITTDAIIKKGQYKKVVQAPKMFTDLAEALLEYQSDECEEELVFGDIEGRKVLDFSLKDLRVLLSQAYTNKQIKTSFLANGFSVFTGRTKFVNYLGEEKKLARYSIDILNLQKIVDISFKY